MIPTPSPAVVAGFIILPLLVSAAFVLGCGWDARRAGEDAHQKRALILRVSLGVIGWLIVTALVARSGILARFDLRPPPFAILVLCLFTVAFAIAFSRLGTRLVQGLPLWALVGFHVFRLPLEFICTRPQTKA